MEREGIMADFNLYWSVYKNLEREVLELTKYVHVDDNQLKVYSMHIADLIVRCAVEIESLSKELYWLNGGVKLYDDETGKERDLYFDTDCLNYLDGIWGICKKKVIVSCIEMYFEKEENRIISPLHKANKRGSSGAIWNKAYQAVKHDRKNSLSKATIKNLIYVLGALYILNLYYKDDVQKITWDSALSKNIDDRMGSEIFAVTYANATSVVINEELTDNAIDQRESSKLETAVCIYKYTSHVWDEIHKEWNEYNDRIKERTVKLPEVRDFLIKNPDYRANNCVELLQKVGGTELVRKVVTGGFGQTLIKGQKEFVMNKGQIIYQ